jgi:hypothetical protein
MYFDDEKKPKTKTSEFVRGFVILVILGILTGFEYWLGATEHDSLLIFSSATVPLILVALVKAGLIINYYMHISRMWSSEEEGH